jgi:hypothetical protein
VLGFCRGEVVEDGASMMVSDDGEPASAAEAHEVLYIFRVPRS